MNIRPALWSLALAAAVVLAGCNKHTTDDTMQPGAGTTPATSATAPGMAPAGTMPPASSTAMMPPSSSTASMPPPIAPAPSSTTGH
jgi:hypothetical protein